MATPHRRHILVLVGVVAALAIDIPVMGADPAPSASPPGQTKPDESAKPEKGPEVTVTMQGTVKQTADENGRPTFTLTAGGKTWDLSAGPTWFWGDKNPLKGYVGKSISVAGTYRAGGTELDVETIDGKALREGGKPPWAGGPWVVGATHPGWKAWMADGKPGKGLGRETAPGQTKDKTTGH
jgi:hypothetical protein